MSTADLQIPANCDSCCYADHEWVLWRDNVDRPVKAQLDVDTLLLDAVSRRSRPATIRLWQNRRAMIVSRQDSHRPRFEEAVTQLMAQGTPVLVRSSGGTAVLHEVGVINFSMVYPLKPAQQFDIGAAYETLCRPLIDTLSELGLDARMQSVDGAFCDGRFNLAIGGRKITGTAQRIRRAVGTQAVLAHASTLLDTDVERFCRLLEEFYRLSGDPRELPVNAVTTVRQELRARRGIDIDVCRFEEILIDRLKRYPH